MTSYPGNKVMFEFAQQLERLPSVCCLLPTGAQLYPSHPPLVEEAYILHQSTSAPEIHEEHASLDSTLYLHCHFFGGGCGFILTEQKIYKILTH